MKKVTVYTSSSCSGCVSVKKFLSRKGMDYQELNIDEQPDLMAQITNLTGQSRVPVTMVEDSSGMKRVTTGFNPGELSSLLA